MGWSRTALVVAAAVAGVGLVAAVAALGTVASAAGERRPTVAWPAAHIAGEWRPGITAEQLGGQLTVDGYGVGGLGAYPLADGAATVAAVCIQADIGHSATVEYQPDGAPAVTSAELDYLLWAYLGPGGGSATDAQAAAINALAWRAAGALRSTGGPVWTGDGVEIAVTGGGRLHDVEAAVAALDAEAAARRGPWTLELDLVAVPGGVEASATLTGPGGPIAGQPVVFAVDGGRGDAVVTDADGRASWQAAGAPATVAARTDAPGAAVTWSAPDSQRLASAGPPTVVEVVETVLPPSPTSTTTTVPTTTVPATTTTTVPTATTTTTVPATTTTTTVPATTTTTTTVPDTTTTTTTVPATTAPGPATTVAPTTVAPGTSALTAPPVPTTTAAPPPAAVPTSSVLPVDVLADTGAASPAAVRIGAWAIAAGGLARLAAAGGRRRPRSG